MSQITSSQFAWKIVGDGREHPPPHDPAPDTPCWLCGGDTNGKGWQRAIWLPPTFTNHNLAARITSPSICQSCVAMSSKDTWERYVSAHPEMGLKTGHAMSWRSYSHAFSEAGHECPGRARWRELLINPPKPPFVFCISTSGQKHLVFRCRIAGSRELYPVQFEDTKMRVRRTSIVRCLADFEEGLAAGLSRDGLLTGRYNSKYALKAGLKQWRDIEKRIGRWRRVEPWILTLAHRFATSPEKSKEAETCVMDLTPKTSPQQLGPC